MGDVVAFPNRQPVTTLDELETLDLDEVTEGYRDGYAGFPCGNNRSRSYWHGWKNGQVDGGHREKDNAQAILAMNVAPKGRLDAILNVLRRL